MRGFWAWRLEQLKPWLNLQKHAHIELAKAIKRGSIPPAKELHCVDCGQDAEHWDHRDYLKPLDVVPVCRSCNAMRGPALPYHDGSQHYTVQEWRWRYRQQVMRMRKLEELDLLPIQHV